MPPTRRQGVTFDDFVRARLPELLRYLADQTEAQTAHLMGCSVGTVMSQANAAMHKLRQMLDNTEEES